MKSSSQQRAGVSFLYILAKLDIVLSASRGTNIRPSFFFFKDLFILAVGGLRCCAWALSSCWTSLVVRWIGIRLPAQGTLVRALVQEDPTSPGATTTEPVCLEPMLATTEATAKNKQKVN